MKIVISAVTYHPTVGGADDFVRSIAEGVRREHHDVTVVASDLLRHVDRVPLEDSSERVLNGVRVVRCRHRWLPGHVYPFWPDLARHIREIRPDLIHAFGLGYFSVDGASRFASEIPLIVSPTGGRYRSGRFYGILRHFLGKNAVKARLWTALSRDEERTLRRDWPDAPRIEILSPSIDPAEWRFVRPDPFPDLPRTGRILFAGRLARDKGIGDLIKAVQRIRERMPAELLVAGPDYGFEKPSIPGVHFLGALERDTLCAAYQNSDVVVLPSYHEGFGIVLLEGMAAGAPIVAYDNTSMPELARNDETGFTVPTGEIDRLADAIIRLLADPALRRRLARRAREIALGEYSRAAMTTKVLDFYRSIATGDGTDPASRPPPRHGNNSSV